MNVKQMAKPAPKTECYFLPLSKVEKVAEFAEDPGSRSRLSYCKRNLFMLQSWKSVPGSSRTRECSIEFRYHKAIKRAIMTHDWDKLLFLLLKWPKSEHNSDNKRMLQRYDTYLRAYMILMLNHPAAKSQSLLMEHFHMVLGCRHDEDKKALMKILVSLPEKLRVRDSRVRELAEPPTRVGSEPRSLDGFESQTRAENLRESRVQQNVEPVIDGSGDVMHDRMQMEGVEIVQNELLKSLLVTDDEE